MNSSKQWICQLSEFIGLRKWIQLLHEFICYGLPAPWAGRHLSMDEQHLFQQNQIVLINFCLQRMRMLLGSCLVKGSLEQLVRMFPTLTHCGGKVYDMFVSWKLVFVPATRIIRLHTRKRSARRWCGFTTLWFFNCFTPSFVLKKMFVLSMRTVHCFFVRSFWTKLNNT
jgi:hypothetical protein